MSKLYVILVAYLLAGCSNYACQPQSTTSIEPPALTAMSLAYTPGIGKAITRVADPKAAETARAQASEADADDANMAASAPPQFDTRADGPKTKPATDFMIANPKLFSATEDRRPWPMKNSAEWAEREKNDERWEKEITRVIQICRC